MTPGALADLLTLGRMALAPVIAVVVGADNLAAGVVVLIAAWLTDLADGRLARLRPGTSHLGAWDPLADAAIGAGLLAGLSASGRVTPVFAGIFIVVLGGGLVVLRNLALGMLLQAVAYAFLFGALWNDAREWFWALVIAVVPIAVIDGARLVRVILPDFFGGVRKLVPGDATPTEEET
ncbi:MAG: CDP-alcohol phosphatidyltransferase family protein [Acidimicrobiia bacterium]|nr:CDP-alcohol phosphatidyltransferase family protein [Acidimicrobiia bacterium]